MSSVWLDLELRHLESFRTLAQTLSFRRTATELGFAQSAISSHIASLERRVGARLVERAQGKRTVALTPAGQLLLEHADAILGRIAVAERDFTLRAHRQAQPVRLGVFQSVAARLLPAALARSTQRAPGLRLELVASERPLPLLVGGKLDLAFTETPPDDARLRHLELLDDPYVLLVRASEPQKRDGPVSLDALARSSLLTYRTCWHLTQVERNLAERGIALRPRFRSDDAPTLHGLVASGVGVALLPRLAVDPDDARVRSLPVDPTLPARLICLAWHGERRFTEEMNLIAAAINEAAVQQRERPAHEPAAQRARRRRHSP
jgi:DNA-binding transcriptional LysR family regulator